MKKRKILLIFASVGATLNMLILILVFLYFPVIMEFFETREGSYPAPVITHGEFPFELTYKLNGELYTVKDTYICDYDGLGFNMGIGNYRKWSGYIKSTGETAVLITEDSDRQIFCSVGDTEFYMNDEIYP